MRKVNNHGCIIQAVQSEADPYGDTKVAEDGSKIWTALECIIWNEVKTMGSRGCSKLQQ